MALKAWVVEIDARRIRKPRAGPWDLSLPRSPTAFLARVAATLLLASFGGALGATRAFALDQGDDVSRLFSFGGACVSCELSGRKLPDAHFVGANFSSAMMVASDLRGAWFVGANFSKANLARADLRGANLLGTDFLGTDFTDANLAGIRGHGADFNGANLTRTSLENASLLGSDLTHVTAHDAIFNGAALFGANLSNGHFERASFKGASLIAANLNGSTFAGADFTGANLTHADLAGADLSAAKGLTQAQIDQACSANGATRLPPGLSARSCHSTGPNVLILHATHGSGPHFIAEDSGF